MQKSSNALRFFLHAYKKISGGRSFIALIMAIIAVAFYGKIVEEKMVAASSDDHIYIDVEYPAEARGADQMFLSPNGRWLVLSYMIRDEAPLLVRLDRKKMDAPSVERGFLGGPPTDDGTLYFIEQQAADNSRLLVTPADERRSFLRRWGDNRRLMELNGAYGVYSVNGKTVILFGGGDNYDEIIVTSEDGEIAARKDFSGIGNIVSRAFDDEHIYLLIDQFQQADDRSAQEALGIIKLDANTLEKLWQQEDVAPAAIFMRPELHLYERGARLLLTSNSSSKMAAFASSTGVRLGVTLDCPVGHGLLHVMPTAKPADAAFIIWRESVRTSRDWRILRVSKKGIDVVLEGTDTLPAMSGVWDGSRALLAAYGGTTPGEPKEWNPVVRGYWERQ